MTHLHAGEAVTETGDRSRPRATLPGLCATKRGNLTLLQAGNLTLLQATAVTDRWGTTDYGRLSGLLAAPATIAAALAPFAGAALAGPLGGYPGVFAVLALVSAGAALFTLGDSPSHCSAHRVQVGVVHE
jgi:hypothetical protein